MYTNMWAYGQHLRIKDIDVIRLTQDSSVVASFKQLSHASSRDTNLVDSELGYVGSIVGIYEISYRIFKQVNEIPVHTTTKYRFLEVIHNSIVLIRAF